MKLDITEYRVKAPVGEKMLAAMLSDVHGEEFGYVLDKVRERKPDLILIPGDVTNRHDPEAGNGGAFLRACAETAPTFMSLGNHERNSCASVREAAASAGVTLLEERSVSFRGLLIGGLTSGYVFEEGKLRQGHWRKTPPPRLDWLGEFAANKEYKVLLSHHPEYYPRYEKALPIDLILSGHAHGGQWRIFGHPVFAPDQALFPKYAQGFHDGRLIVGRGLANNGPVPRFGNNRELIFITFEPENENV